MVSDTWQMLYIYIYISFFWINEWTIVLRRQKFYVIYFYILSTQGTGHMALYMQNFLSHLFQPWRGNSQKKGQILSPWSSEISFQAPKSPWTLSRPCFQTPSKQKPWRESTTTQSRGWYCLIKQRPKSPASGWGWASGTWAGNISSLGGKKMTNSFLKEPSRQSELLDVDK